VRLELSRNAAFVLFISYLLLIAVMVTFFAFQGR
jgi:hypothetical protein